MSNQNPMMQFLTSHRLLDPNSSTVNNNSNDQSRVTTDISQVTLNDNNETLPAKKAANYDKNEICEMIKKKSENLKIEQKLRNDKYMVNVILVAEGEKFVPSNFIQCIMCSVVLSKDGGGVSKHYESCSSRRGQKRPARESITPFLQGTMTSAQLKKTTTAVGKFALNSGLSFYRCAEPPLKQLCTDLINIGAELQKQVTIEDLEFGRKAVKNAAMKFSEAEMIKLKPILREAAEKGEITFAVDHGKRFNDYLSLVAHICIENDNNSWQMITRTIGFLRVKPDEKDHKSIFSQVQDLCVEMGISRFDLSYCGVVSDEGSSIVKALKGNFKRDIRCICHVLCTVTSHIFKPYKKTTLSEAELEQVKIANELLTASKIISSSARSLKGGLKLKKKPRQFVNTRFMSSLWVLEDILESYDELLQYTENPSILSDEVEDAINLIVANKKRLQFLIEVLKPVETHIRKFEAEKYPTIHLVAIFWYEQIKRANGFKTKPDTFQKAIGAAYFEALDRKKKNLTPYHFAATTLFPPTKNMLNFSDTDRDQAKEILEYICLDYEPEPSTNNNAEDDAPLSSMYDQQALSIDNFANELKRYQQSTEEYESKIDLMKWWFDRQKIYPRLSQAAKKILSMPPSSTAPERSFSRLKLVITDQRSLLDANTVSGLMLGGPY